MQLVPVFYWAKKIICIPFEKWNSMSPHLSAPDSLCYSGMCWWLNGLVAVLSWLFTLWSFKWHFINSVRCPLRFYGQWWCSSISKQWEMFSSIAAAYHAWAIACVVCICIQQWSKFSFVMVTRTVQQQWPFLTFSDPGKGYVFATGHIRPILT